MLDPRREAVLILDRATGEVDKRSWNVAGYATRAVDGKIDISFNGSSKAYTYGADRVLIMQDPASVPLTGARVEVRGQIWGNATEVWKFTGPRGDWWRIFYTTTEKEEHRTYPASQVCIVPDAAEHPVAAGILTYWRNIVSRLPDNDPLQRQYEDLSFVHPESALGRYLGGAAIEYRALASAPIFPFRCNLSQREAVENGLTRSISVIEGPPGTGKTETILNLVANIITRDETVAVVSFNNAAVDNVREKLDELGFGHVIANLGRREKRDEFFAGQEARNDRVATSADDVPQTPPPAKPMAEVDRRLRRAQMAERTRAELRGEADAYRLELRHFEHFLQRHEVPELEGLPLLGRSSDRILSYLVESELEHGGASPGLLRRIRKYFRYGSLRGLDPDDTDVLLQLQRAFYEKQISGLEAQVGRVEDELRRADFDRLTEEHRELSNCALRVALGDRYQSLSRTTYAEGSYRRGGTFERFVKDYPVVLSTCHSLRASIADDYLIDYVIIDEASQVDLLAAGLALSCCRNVVVVGDRRQLPHIARDAANGLEPANPAYDDREHNILSSLTDLYRDELPYTLLREHYRCEPAIIGFCNKAFYDGDLIPFTTSEAERPLIVVRTAEGNHMRQHRGGGRSNQREVDVIVNEVIPEHCEGVQSTDIGITSPYRRQADKAADAMIDPVEADTVHKFQGRQKQVVIFTTVLDESWRGQTGLAFVDNPCLINVAVSRAVKQFILVANHDMLPKSRHIRDLIGYIRYHSPDEDVVDSAVVSMFDLLYREYSDRLRPLAARLRNEMKYKSEDIVWTALHDIIADDRYSHLTLSYQVQVRNLLFDLTRLTPRQEAFVRRRASVDFVVYNRVTNDPLLAIEVDGFAFHENDPAQLERDAIKDEILRAYQLPLLRLATTGSGEDQRIREALNDAEAPDGRE